MHPPSRTRNRERNGRKFNVEGNFQRENFISIFAKLFNSVSIECAETHCPTAVKCLISALSILDLLRCKDTQRRSHEAFMNLGNHWLDSVDNLANNRQPRLNDPILDVEETLADHSRPIERKERRTLEKIRIERGFIARLGCWNAIRGRKVTNYSDEISAWERRYRDV